MPYHLSGGSLGLHQNLMCFGFECGSGWNDPILNLSLKAEELTVELKDRGAEPESICQWLREQLMEPLNGKTVVIMHHAPSFECNHKEFGMNLLSPGFISNLIELVTLADV